MNFFLKCVLSFSLIITIAIHATNQCSNTGLPTFLHCRMTWRTATRNRMTQCPLVTSYWCHFSVYTHKLTVLCNGKFRQFVQLSGANHLSQSLLAAQSRLFTIHWLYCIVEILQWIALLLLSSMSLAGTATGKNPRPITYDPLENICMSSERIKCAS